MPPSSIRYDASYDAPTFVDENSTLSSSRVPPVKQSFAEGVYDGPAFCDSRNSTVASSVRRRNKTTAPPVLPVSPIKQQTVNGTLRDRDSMSFRRRADKYNSSRFLENHLDLGETRDLDLKEHSILGHLKRATADDEVLSIESVDTNNLQMKGIYDEIAQTRELFKERKRSTRRQESPFITPKPSFILGHFTESPIRLDSASSIEAARHSPVVNSRPVPMENRPPIEKLFDLSLDRANHVNFAPRRSLLSTNPVAVPLLPSEPFRRTPGAPPSPVSMSTLRCSPPREEPLHQKPKSRAETQSAVRALLRGLNIDVDSISHKGLLSSSRRHLNSAGVKNALGGGRSQSVPRPRPHTAGSLPRKSPPRVSPKKPAFCSTASIGNISQSILANEQTLLKVVTDYFPHWRIFVRNLLADETVGDDVAFRFLKEIKNRKNIREMDLRMERTPLEDERRYEFNRVDARILDRLEDQLKRHNPSRIQQLRILCKVLEDAGTMR